jgi:hypothetical protein
MFEKIVYWIAGIVFFIFGLLVMIFHTVTGIIISIVGLMMIPNLTQFLSKKTNIEISKKIKLLIYLFIFILWAGSVYYSYINADLEKQKDILDFILFFGILGGLFLALYLPEAMRSKKRKSLLSAFNNINNFQRTKSLLSYDLKSAIALDENNKKICLVTKKGGDPSCKVIEYKDLLSSEIIENNDSITKTARGSQVGGAILGGILLGGVGALIGGLSGKKHNTSKVKNINLQILINDTKEPVFTVNFLSVDDKDGYSRDSEMYKSSMSLATRWHSILKIIINDMDEKDKKLDSTSCSIADEILKLKALNNDGFITDAEFTAQKNKLLNS